MFLRKSPARATGLGAIALIVLVLLGVGSPAMALGSKSITCYGTTSAIGDSGQLYGGRTQPSTIGSTVCGNMAVNVKYQAYANSPVYWSGWK